MTKQITPIQALSEAFNLTGAISTLSYHEMSESEVKDLVFKYADHMLNPKNDGKLQKIVDLITDNWGAIQGMEDASLDQEQKNMVFFLGEVREIVLPLSTHYVNFFQTDLGDNWGDPYMDNTKAIDFAMTSQWHYINYFIAYKLAVFTAASYFDEGNPIVGEYIMGECVNTKYELTQKGAVDIAATLIGNVRKVLNHIEIGRRLGMDKYARAVYDALKCKFDEAYDPQYLDAALELSQWTYHTPHEPLPTKLEFARMVVAKAEKVRGKYGIKDEMDEETISYLINELLLDIYPEEDEIEPFNLDEDVLSDDSWDEDDEDAVIDSQKDGKNENQ